MKKYIDAQAFYQAEKERCGGCEPMIGSHVLRIMFHSVPDSTKRRM